MRTERAQSRAHTLRAFWTLGRAAALAAGTHAAGRSRSRAAAAPTRKQHGELRDDHQVALVDARRDDAAAGDAPGLEAAGRGGGHGAHLSIRELRAGQLEGHARRVAPGAPQEAPVHRVPARHGLASPPGSRPLQPLDWRPPMRVRIVAGRGAAAMLAYVLLMQAPGSVQAWSSAHYCAPTAAGPPRGLRSPRAPALGVRTASMVLPGIGAGPAELLSRVAEVGHLCRVSGPRQRAAVRARVGLCVHACVPFTSATLAGGLEAEDEVARHSQGGCGEHG